MLHFIRMKHKKPLSQTNRYLKDPAERERRIKRFVATSNGVEGIYVDLGKVAARSQGKSGQVSAN